MTEGYFDNYTVQPVHDKRTTGNYCSYAVVAHNGITITDCGGWELPDQKILFTTELDVYDGGRAACDAFIEGYKQGLPMRMVETTVVSGCPEPEGNGNED